MGNRQYENLEEKLTENEGKTSERTDSQQGHKDETERRTREKKKQ